MTMYKSNGDRVPAVVEKLAEATKAGEVDRREFLATAASSAFALRTSAPRFPALLLAPRYDLVIRGGVVFDGSGDAGTVMDVAIAGDRIAAIGRRVSGTGAREIDARDRAVAPGARESSLSLAGQRTGAWVFERSYAAAASGTLHEAIESIGVPALRELVEVEQKGDQLHIHNSPLCAEHDHSGCGFFSGYLEGVLGPAVGSDHLSIFPVCCRSFGADACVLAISG